MDIDIISKNNEFTINQKNMINILLNVEYNKTKIYKILFVIAVNYNNFDLVKYLINNNLLNINSEIDFNPEKMLDLISFKKKNNRIEINLENNCAICKNNYTNINNISKLKCSHHFHTKCIIPWLIDNNSCPCCRKQINSL